MIAVWVLLALLMLVLLVFIFLYNSLVSRRVQCQEAFAQIDTHLKRRYDLIPNLVETVRGYAAHEKETLERVVNARNAAQAAKEVGERADAENMLTGTLRQIFALSESYPALKANQNFAMLQSENARTEDQIAITRQRYNSIVAEYNTAIEQFPAKIVADMFAFKKQPFFEIEDAAQREAPKVQF